MTTKIEELRQKPKEELQKILEEKKERLRVLRFDLAAGKVKNVREIRKLRKDIARILTLLIEADRFASRGLQRGRTRKNPRKSA